MAGLAFGSNPLLSTIFYRAIEMIYKYNSSEFETLKNIVVTYFNDYVATGACTEKQRKIINIFNTIFDDKNIDKVQSLDRQDLKFNRWVDINEAINSHLLSYQNSILFKIHNDNNSESLTPNVVIDSLYLTLYADMYEFSLVTEDPFLRSFFSQQSEELVFNSDHLSEDSFKRLTYLWFIIPKEVFNRHLQQHLDPEVIETVAMLKSNKDFMAEKLTANDLLKKEIKEIQKSLEAQKSEYNFVGLSKGFTSLKTSKKTELDAEKITYNRLMIIIISLIIIKAVWSVYYLSTSEINSPMFIMVTVSTVLFLFILLYFFRISLVNVKSIKSQILQIDLRLTLCQFIHNYDSNTKDLREGMKESFSKFESVIFSPLVATEDQMPSTFDGLEQLTGMIGLFNKKSD